MFNQNHITTFIKYEFPKNDWTDFDKFIKIEPIYSFKNRSLNLISIEFNFSWFLSISPNIIIPLNNQNNSIYYGIRFGYYLPNPIKLR